MAEETITFMAQVSEKVVDVGRQLIPERFRLAVVPIDATDAQAAQILAEAEYFLGFIAHAMGPAFYAAL